MPGPSSIAMCAALSHGGIAHYTYALAEGLQASGLDTSVLMYDEPEYDLVGYPHAHRPVPSLRLATSRRRRLTSPAQNLAAVLRASLGRPLVHFQWSLGPRNDRLIWSALRAAGKRIVYTAHDVVPHEPDIMPREHCAWVYERADAIIVHGQQLKALLLENFPVPAQKVHVVPHGNYNFVADTPGRWTRDSARASLGLSAAERAVLFFGLIREYKGLDVLIDACQLLRERGLPDGHKLKLVIAGRSFKNHWHDARYEERIAQAQLTDAVSLHLEHIPMLDVARFFHAADVVAVPYRRGSQSGVLQLAYSFAKGSVATRVGSLAEGPTGDLTRFVEPSDAGALADALFEMLGSESAAATLGSKARAYADSALGWGAITDATRAIYDSLR
jgi:D-inositol-3-phosphate glycosyltransferase